MPKHTRKHNNRNNKRTRKHRKPKRKLRKIGNPSGLSHLYTSVYGPRAYKGGYFTPSFVI
jgi:hypothetical protein